MNAKLNQVDQSSLVNELLGGNFSVTLVRNFYSDPRSATPRTTSGGRRARRSTSPKFDDPTVQAALDAGRTSTDDAALEKAYEDFNKAMAKGVYIVPAWYREWALASKGVTGQAGAPLPDGSKPLVLNARFPVDDPLQEVTRTR